MRKATLATLIAAAAITGAPGIAAAAPTNYCGDLKGVDNGQTCDIQQSASAYQVKISFPSRYPDLKPVADYISRTRDGFLNVAKASNPGDVPFELDITATSYTSTVPPRTSESLVLQNYENIGGAHPGTSFKAFNWDQASGTPITYDTLWRPDADPLPVVYPIVVAELQKQAGQPISVDPVTGMDPASYQDFAITNDGVIFFFSQGQLLPESAGATQVLVPRSAIDPLLA
ncbi:immunogenic protein MPB64 [Mycobacterium sp. ENV421]|uniref:esterase n=1 Tax=Mycobacterium sp. ENV421 TaxID=1213407 RepID=UPI000C9BC6F4|nr:esterase [Mycobacterium sp. ENV421]PND58541.1 immunogenic protein MPB64 [Mycobacterium sp. ENV421]